MCVIFFYDDKAMGTYITLSQLDAAAPESSYPFGDKPVSQPALSKDPCRTLSHCSSPCTVVLSGIYIAAPTGVPTDAGTDCRLAQPVTPETV